jgi:hypothetical protein
MVRAEITLINLPSSRSVKLNDGQQNPPQRAPVRRDGKIRSIPAKAILEPEASAELRDRLLNELNHLVSGDDAAIWAHRRLVEKNRLTAADAQRVEEAFQATLAISAAHAGDASQMAGATRAASCTAVG